MGAQLIIYPLRGEMQEHVGRSPDPPPQPRGVAGRKLHLSPHLMILQLSTLAGWRSNAVDVSEASHRAHYPN